MKQIGTYLIIGLFLVIGLKSCIRTVISFDDYVYAEVTENGQIDKVILTPKNEMIYVKRYQDIIESGIYKIKGDAATHYLGSIYCVGSFPFGLRNYKNADKVLDAQLILSHKNGDSFPDIGESYKASIVIYPDKVKIGKYTYKKFNPTESEVAEIERVINRLKAS